MNTMGKLFSITTWGESHGPAIGVTIDGCPSLLELSEADIQEALDRRRPGQSSVTTPRDEADRVKILSGVYQGKTTGAPISLIVENTDMRPSDYDEIQKVYRPSHSDYTYQIKYGIRDPRGGGRASARITVGRVAAGAIAQKLLRQAGIEVLAYVKRVKDLEATIPEVVSRQLIEASLVRCPDPKASDAMVQLIESARDAGDSLGGVIECVVNGVPVGLGEPEFDKLDADLGKVCLSIPATKGFEVGSGFAGTNLYGSEHNDPFVMEEGKIQTASNRSGGIQGGISNGMPIVVRVAFKPTSTIAMKQQTVSLEEESTTIEGKGRHDPCVLPRAVPIVEASVALCICDHWLRLRAYKPPETL